MPQANGEHDFEESSGEIKPVTGTLDDGLYGRQIKNITVICTTNQDEDSLESNYRYHMRVRRSIGVPVLDDDDQEPPYEYDTIPIVGDATLELMWGRGMWMSRHATLDI